jgi:hypothetical protein
VLAAFIPCAQVMSDALFEGTRPDKNSPVIMFSKMDSIEVGLAYSQLCDGWDDRKLIGHCDNANHDGHMGQGPCKLHEDEIWPKFRCWREDDLARDYTKDMHNTVAIGTTGVVARFKYCTNSGELITSVKNGVANSIAILSSAGNAFDEVRNLEADAPIRSLSTSGQMVEDKRSRLKRISLESFDCSHSMSCRVGVAGDDGLVYLNGMGPHHISDIKYYFEENMLKFGFETEIFFNYMSDAKFCSGRFYLVNTIRDKVEFPVWGNLIGRTLYKMFWKITIKSVHDTLVWLEEILIGRYFDFFYIPVLRRVSFWLLNNLFKSRFEEFKLTKFRVIDGVLQIDRAVVYRLLNDDEDIKYHCFKALNLTEHGFSNVANWYGLTVDELSTLEIFIDDQLKDVSFAQLPLELSHPYLDRIIQKDVGEPFQADD